LELTTTNVQWSEKHFTVAVGRATRQSDYLS